MVGLEGRTLDRYQLRKIIGGGGMADVYLGYSLELEQEVAIKVFKREDEKLLERFIREAKLMSSLQHKHLMPIYGAGEVWLDGFKRYYIVMPHIQGGTLRARFRRSPVPSLQEISSYLREIASALDYIHTQGVIHRDIKSSNVILSLDDHCYLSDFGIARTMTDSTSLTTTGHILGTADYAAPELFVPHWKVDARCDLYSLGVLLFEMVTGRLPFAAENALALVTMHVNEPPPLPSNLISNLSPQVERVILKGLAKNPDERYRNASELADAFCQAVSKRAMTRKFVMELEKMPVAALVPAGITEREISLPPPSEMSPSYPVEAPKGPNIQPSDGSYNPVTPLPLVPEPEKPRQVLNRKRVLTLAVVALLALLAVVGPIGYTLLNPPHVAQKSIVTTHQKSGGTIVQNPSTAETNKPKVTATATSNPAALATQQAIHASATASAGATATAQAVPSATAGVIQTATTGTPAYKDSLTNANNPAAMDENWSSTRQCTFSQDGYHATNTVILFQSLMTICDERGVQYGNVALSVNVKMLNGQDGGLLFNVHRFGLGGYTSDLFEVDSQGHYRIVHFSNAGSNAVLQDWTTSPALKNGYEVTNTLQVIVRDGNISAYINGVYQTSVQDTSLSSGALAFLSNPSEGSGSEVVYSDISVYTLP